MKTTEKLKKTTDEYINIYVFWSNTEENIHSWSSPYKLVYTLQDIYLCLYTDDYPEKCCHMSGS